VFLHRIQEIDDNFYYGTNREEYIGNWYDRWYSQFFEKHFQKYTWDSKTEDIISKWIQDFWEKEYNILNYLDLTLIYITELNNWNRILPITENQIEYAIKKSENTLSITNNPLLKEWSELRSISLKEKKTGSR
jgi:hypothetical protein